MSRFWQFICVVLAVVFFVMWQLPHPQMPRYDDRPTLAAQLVGFALLGSLVAVIWAICFRPQVEKLRISLFSLFALVAMEALLLLAARVLNSN